VPSTLAVTAVVHLLTATSFLVVAAAIWRRRLPDMRGATAAILVWWTCLAGYLYLQAGLHLWASFVGPDLATFLWSRLLAIPLLCACAGGLTYYILYLITGKAWLRWPVAILFLMTAILFHVALFLPMPTALRTTPWLIELDIADTSLLMAVYAMVGLPPILGSAALLWVARRMGPPQRYRATMVGLAILAYVGSGLAAFTSAGDTAKLLVLNGMGLVAASLVLLAYYPTRPIRARFGIESAPELERQAALKRAERRAQFRRRGGELV